MIAVGKRVRQAVREMTQVLKEKAVSHTGIRALVKVSLGAAR